jgi:proline iminopeptidase
MSELYPQVEPYETGMLEVGSENHIYWEVCGNPNGKPALVVHGGPGSGCTTSHRRYFDPERYQVILFDQRGCGRSQPPAWDPETDMRQNTTDHLLADMERLREHLGIDRWLLFGGSWGSTLSLAYAEEHPQRVTELVLSGVTTTRPSEIEWLYHGVSRFFPEAWERFRAGAGTEDDDLIAGYARQMADPDPEIRRQAADAWCAWEDTVISEEPNGATDVYSRRERKRKHSFVRIAAHYFAHKAWLEDGVLLRNADRLAGIPGVLIHGRLDLAAPLETAWKLHCRWSDSELIIVDDAGHTGSETMTAQKVGALDLFGG